MYIKVKMTRNISKNQLRTVFRNILAIRSAYFVEPDDIELG